jgi:SAM-dependent methyltransferase
MDPEYAKLYARLYREHWWWRAREEYLVGLLRRRLPPGRVGRVLDVGCGGGLLFDRLAEFGEVYGVESDASMRTGEPEIDSRIHWGPLESFSGKGPFDLALMLDVLEHLDRPEQALRMVGGLLAPGALLMVTVPAFMSIWTRHDELNHHRTRYTGPQLSTLVTGAALRVLETRYFFNWLWAIKRALRTLEHFRIAGRPERELPSIPGPLVNGALFYLSRLEQKIGIPRVCPFGSSLLVLATKPPTPWAGGRRPSAADDLS